MSMRRPRSWTAMPPSIYAHVLKDLADTHFPDAETIVLVQDNLNTHKPASLYEAFPAAEARRLAMRFEWHYTPKHDSWLDMAESELGVLSDVAVAASLAAAAAAAPYCARRRLRSILPKRVSGMSSTMRTWSGNL